jgi:hypothetical protein
MNALREKIAREILDYGLHVGTSLASKVTDSILSAVVAEIQGIENPYVAIKGQAGSQHWAGATTMRLAIINRLEAP